MTAERNRSEGAALVTRERAHLVKWDACDLLDDEMTPREGAEPLEVLVVDDGEIVEHWKRGDADPPPLPPEL